jgi:hypothetical protein
LQWIVEIGDEFQPEFDTLPEEVQDELLAKTRLLQQFGPQLGRPNVDTIQSSGWDMEGSFRFRPRTQSRHPCSGRQIWR